MLNKQIPSTDSASATRLSAQCISAVHRALHIVSPSLMKTKVIQAKKIGLFYWFFFKRRLNYEHLKTICTELAEGIYDFNSGNMVKEMK